MRARRFSYLILAILLVLIINPSKYFVSVQNGLSIFVYSVLPSMLPFFFFTKLLTSFGGANGLSATIGKPLGKMYKCSSLCGYAFIISILSGYPVGARVICDLRESGGISDLDADKMSSFCSTSGSMFVLGSVGSAIIGNVSLAWIILICHYISAILTGIIFNFKRRSYRNDAPIPISATNVDNILSETMYSSIVSLAMVGGYIAICNLAADMFMDLIAFWGGKTFVQNASIFLGMLLGLFEVTRGCITFANCGLGNCFLCAFSCAVISFGGLSVILQSMSFLSKCKVKASKFVIQKIVQAFLAFALSFCTCFLCEKVGVI